MTVDRVLADDKAFGDLAVGEALGDPQQDLPLARRQPCERTRDGRTISCLEEPRCTFRLTTGSEEEQLVEGLGDLSLGGIRAPESE